MKDTSTTLPHNIPHHIEEGVATKSSPGGEADASSSGVVLGSFRLLEKLGEGTYATAYLAEQIGMDRSAVVKIAHASLLDGHMEEMIRRRFEVEVRASTRVKHTNIVTVYTAGDVEGAPAIAMEYVSGETLERFLSRAAPMTERAFASLFSQLAQALVAMHRMDIIHRDVSPRNIIVQELSPGRFSPKLLDFGISQLDGATHYTAGPIGTPQFMAPEILRGETSKAADVFSLGSLMWWAATGEIFAPEGLSQAELFKFLVTLKPTTGLTGRLPSFSTELCRLIEQMLMPLPESRPSAVEVAAVLDAHLGAANSHESAEFYVPRVRTSDSELARAARVLLLTSLGVQARELEESLVASGLRCQKRNLREWQRSNETLDGFDVILLPIDRSEGEGVMRLNVIEIAAMRARAQRSVTFYAYGDGKLPRDTLRRMGVDESWEVPHELDALTGSLASVRSSYSGAWQRIDSDVVLRTLSEDPNSMHALIDEFIGGMPEWLLELEEALELKNRAKIFTLCGELSSRAMSVGAENILAITREFCALSVTMYEVRGQALLDQLEDEYKLLFRDLHALQQQQ